MKFGIITKEEYDAFWNNYYRKSFINTSQMANVKEKENYKVYYLGLKKNNELIGASILVSIKSHFGKYDFYSPRGFLIDYNNKDLIKIYTEYVKNFVKENNGYEFRIDPYIVNVSRDGEGKIVDGIDNRWLNDYLKKLGYKHISNKNAEQGVVWMYALDTKDEIEDSIMRKIKPRTRTLIRKTLKSGIKIRSLKRNELNLFKQIMDETGKNKNFKVRSLSYYESMYDIFSKNNNIKFLIAEINLKDYIENINNEICDAKNKKQIDNNHIESLNRKILNAKKLREKYGDNITLSGAMFILIKPEVVFLYGGNYEEFMDFNAQYILQWEMIKYAVNNKYDRYNFYGISGNFNKDDKEYGVYDFKSRFGGYTEELIGEYAYPTSFIYYIINLIRRFRK